MTQHTYARTHTGCEYPGIDGGEKLLCFEKSLIDFQLQVLLQKESKEGERGWDGGREEGREGGREVHEIDKRTYTRMYKHMYILDVYVT